MTPDTLDESALQTRTDSHAATPASLPMSEIQLRIANEKPRDENAIVKRVSAELQNNRAFADEGFYSIPYKDNRKGIVTFVEGLSIRAAEHLWTRWGNCTVAARVADDRGKKIMVQGMFFDYETGLLNLSDLEVSKFGKSRQGGTFPLSDDKLRLAVQSAESKVKRNAFLGGVPVWIKEGYLNLCQQLLLVQPAGKEQSIDERIKAAELHFTNRYKIHPNDVKEFIVKVQAASPSLRADELLRYLIGLNNAIKDGNVDVDFVFGKDREPAQMPQEKKKEEPNGNKPDPDAAGDAQED